MLPAFGHWPRKDVKFAMLYSRFPRVAYKFISFKLQRANPLTLSVIFGVILVITLVVLSVGFSHTAQSAAFADGPAVADKRNTSLLPDGRENASRVRFDNLCMTTVSGWTKRTGEWAGQWTLEGPNFKTSRIQITGFFAVPLDEKGLKGLADARDASDKQFIDFKEEAPRVEAVHPAGYKTLTTFTSVKAPAYGKECRLYSLHVYLQANGLASHLEYSAAFRANFDKYRPTFEAFLKDTRLFSAQILAPEFDDQPVLEQFTVNQCCDFVEWLIDVPLTDAQREAARDYLTDIWKRHDKAQATQLWDIFKARNQLDELKAEKKEFARQAARAEVIKQWGDEASKGDPMAKLMVNVYDQAHKPIAQAKPGEPALTRQQSDATLEILHFMASKVAGIDVGPSDEQKKEFAAHFAAAYPAMDLDAKKEIQQMPLYWAWLRSAWPDTSEADRAQCIEQWSKNDRIKPIVAGINELKAKGLASDHDAFIDAARRLYQQQQLTAHISNMLAIRHAGNMMLINNIGSSNTRYEYKSVYRYR